MSSAPSGRTGRRRGTTRTRELVAAAARSRFAELGYEQATFRRIAEAAGVDPALVVHFYGSKEHLFREVMQLPPDLAEALVRLADGPRTTVGHRLAEGLVAALESPATRPIIVGRIRAAASHHEAAALVREVVTRDLSRLTAAISDDQPEIRSVLIGAQLVGVVTARYIVRVEPLASLPASELVELLAPTFQHYLVDPLTTPSPPAPPRRGSRAGS